MPVLRVLRPQRLVPCLLAVDVNDPIVHQPQRRARHILCFTFVQLADGVGVETLDDPGDAESIVAAMTLIRDGRAQHPRDTDHGLA